VLSGRGGCSEHITVNGQSAHVSQSPASAAAER